MVAVLLREDVRHVLVRDRAAEAADDRRRAPVGVALPRPGPYHSSCSRPGASASTTPTRGRSRSSVPSRPRSRPAGRRREQPVATAVDRVAQSPRPDARCTTSIRVRVTRTTRAAARAGRARARASAASTPERRSGQQPQAVVVGRRPPELEARPGDEDVPAVDAQLARASRPASTTARVPPASSTPARRCRRRPAARRRGRDAERELLPCDLVARRRPLGRRAEEEAERDEPLAAAAAGASSSTSSASPGATRSRGRLPARHPLAVARQLPRPAQPVEAHEVVAVADPEAARRRRARRAPAAPGT